MPSWCLIIHLTLLLSATFIQARYRAHSKRRHSITTPVLSLDDEHDINFDDPIESKNDDSWLDVVKEAARPRTSTPAAAVRTKFRANEQQIEQFTRLLFDRLNLKEAPNVTANASEATGFPPSIVKQLEQQAKEQQRLHNKEEDQLVRQQKLHDEIMPTAERAIVPGDHIAYHTCQHQIATKLHLAHDQLDNIDCFHFTKSAKEFNSLPSNQAINELRLYMKRSYFQFDEQQFGSLAPEMFQVYQVFLPTSNDTVQKPPMNMKDTVRLSISHMKELSDNWFELTIGADQYDLSLQQLYKQLIMPWYGLAIDRKLQTAPTMPSNGLHYHRQYHSKKHLSYSRRSELDGDSTQEPEHNLPYMLVEYGKKISSSSSGNRGTRDAPSRPARDCHPSSPCCRRSLTIDLDQGSNVLNFVIYPRQLDIGECVGMCGPSGSSLKHTEMKNAQFKNEPNSAYGLFLMHSSLHSNRSTTSTQVNAPVQQQSSQCCSYSRTGGLELMYTTTNGGPIIRKFIPNMVVEECRCGLPATIQQV